MLWIRNGYIAIAPFLITKTPPHPEYQNNNIKMLDEWYMLITDSQPLFYLFTNVWKFDLKILTEHHISNKLGRKLIHVISMCVI